MKGRPLALRLLHCTLLVAACVGVYSNGFDHAFLLDSGHVILDNANVRSLANVPRYFVDPGTFTNLRSNVDYRPVLQITYALNYWMGGYEMPWWHATQVLLHAICTLGIYFLCRRVLEISDPAFAASAGPHVAFAAALLFAVHPTASGVVNYLSARSSMLTAALLLPSILLYMRPRTAERAGHVAWGSAALFALALFTKVEAIGALAIYLLYEVWDRAAARRFDSHFFSHLLATFNRGMLLRLAPFVAIAIVYFAVRTTVMAPFEFEDARQRPGIGSYEYFVTQLVAWWHYVARWFAPIGLVADDLSFPVHRSVLEPPVVLAIGGWVLVAASVLTEWRRRPYLAFLAVSALALLSPTSSILPLSEMVNEHRPYLPVAMLSLCWLIPAFRFAGRITDGARAASVPLVLGFALVAGGFATLTYERNRVFASAQSYWKDVVDKAPSSRAYVNYGLTFMRAGDFETALDLFRKSLAEAPYWHVTHINLAIVYARQDDHQRALEHYDDAVRYDTYSGTALTWRGEYHLSRQRFAEALEDFRGSLEKNLDRYRVYRGIATAYTGLNDAARAFEFTMKCLAVDAPASERDIVSIVTPFFRDEASARAGLDYFERLRERLPDRWWVHANIATLAERTGQPDRAQRAGERAAELRRQPPG